MFSDIEIHPVHLIKCHDECRGAAVFSFPLMSFSSGASDLLALTVIVSVIGGFIKSLYMADPKLKPTLCLCESMCMMHCDICVCVCGTCACVVCVDMYYVYCVCSCVVHLRGSFVHVGLVHVSSVFVYLVLCTRVLCTCVCASGVCVQVCGVIAHNY